MTPEQNKTLYRAIKTYGDEHQTLMLLEEMSELQKELLKNANRKKDNTKDIASEVADVEILLAQIKMIHGIEKEVEDQKDFKIDRLKTYIEGHGDKPKPLMKVTKRDGR